MMTAEKDNFVFSDDDDQLYSFEEDLEAKESFDGFNKIENTNENHHFGLGDSMQQDVEDELCSNDCESICDNNTHRQNHFTQKERVEMIHLRGHLNKLDNKLKEKQYVVDKYRDEFNKCRARILELDMEEKAVCLEMQEANNNGNMASFYRLKAQLNRVVREREGEHELSLCINGNLDKADVELTKSKIERDGYLLADSNLKMKEADYLAHKESAAAFREVKERKYADQTEDYFRRQQYEAKEFEKMRQLQEKITKEKVKEAHDLHNKSLKKTMDSIRNEKQRQEEEYRRDMEAKIKSVLKLKGDITKNRENLTALQARDKDVIKKAAKGEAGYYQDILNDGGNAEVALLRERRIAEFNAEKRVFQLSQKQKQADIAARLLQENKFQELKKKRLPYLFENTHSQQLLDVTPHSKRQLSLVKDIERQVDMEMLGEQEKSNVTQKTQLPDNWEDSSDDDVVGYKLDENCKEQVLNGTKQEDSLAKPEFEGLWNKHKKYSVPKDDKVLIIKDPNASKMEQNIMREVLEKTRANIIIKQVAAGREFKGQPFNSKPELIHFKDFQIGKTYRKRVVLTNVSYSVNYCKFVGMSELLKDFVTLEFNPPGQLSAGMTCDLHVTFCPKINEDLIGEIEFLAQTGPFFIPLHCTTKKCDLSLDKEHVDFGTTVIGETLQQFVILRNRGAKGTTFEFCRRIERKGKSSVSWNDDGGHAVAEAAASEEVGEIRVANTAFEKGIYILGENGIVRGEIGPHSEISLGLEWAPTIPDHVAQEFEVRFEDTASLPLLLKAEGRAEDVPVWVQRETVDLRICMFDRLYQDTVVVHNRASTALRLQFQVHPALASHVELLPKTGYIQANSSFSAQLKFLPRSSLAKDAGDMFDSITGLLEVPMTIRMADQTRPVIFTMTAMVTTSDIEFEEMDLNFGYATIFESVSRTLHVTNHSALPQKFGFMGLPDWLQVQPNDGFGTLLPRETRELYVVFSPSRSGDYKFNLTLKTLINRDFSLPCSGIGVHPPLQLSSQIVHFQSTALNDTSVASFYVENNHISTNQYTHPVPREGATGPIAPVMPTSFEFKLPSDAPLTISPAVGTVKPDGRCHVTVSFTPRLNVADIQKEASRLIQCRLEAEAQAEYRAYLAAQQRLQEEEKNGLKPAGKAAPRGGGKASLANKASHKVGVGMENLADGPRHVEAPLPENIIQFSDEYFAGETSLMRQFQGAFASFNISCFVASGACPTEPGTLPYSPNNTLHLTVHCPATRPQLQIISDHGRQTTNFGPVCIGRTVIKSITVQNISSDIIDLSCSLLDPVGPFQLLNALRQVQVGYSHTLLIGFSPTGEKLHHETIYLRGGSTRLPLVISGRGVKPSLRVQVSDNQFDMGAVLVGDYLERSFKLENISSLAVEFTIKLDSNSLVRYNASQQLPSFVKQEGATNSLVGVQNINGQAVFDCVPQQGSIAAGESTDVIVTFAPDHESDNFSDGVRILLFNQEECGWFRLIGQAKTSIMYVSGGERLVPNIESLSVQTKNAEEPDPKAPAKSFLLTFGSLMLEDGSLRTATRTISVGCVRTMAVSQKKNGEFAFESTNAIAQLGFSVEPQKGQVEAGHKKAVTFQWTPPRGHQPNDIIEASILVTVKGDITENIRILLKALVVTDQTVVLNDDVAEKSESRNN